MSNWWQVPGAQNPYLTNMYGQPPSGSTTVPGASSASPAASWLSPALTAQNDTGDWGSNGGRGNYAAKSGNTDLSKAPPAFGQQAPGMWDGATPSPNAGGALATAQQTAPGNGSYQRGQYNQWGDRGGAQWDDKTGWHGGGQVAAGTTLGATGAKTWVNYDGSKDTYLHDYGDRKAYEPSWLRVNRWTEAGMLEHGLSAQDAHNAALARLKRDMIATGVATAQSGYDLSNVQAAAAGQDWGKATSVGGTTPATATPTTTPGATPVTTPGTPHYDPNTGQLIDPNANTPGYKAPMGVMYSGRPDIAVTDFMKGQGIGAENHSIFADMLRGIAGKLAPTVAQTTGMGGGPGAIDQLANLLGMLKNLLYGNGGHFGQNVADYGQGTLSGLNSQLAGGSGTVAGSLGTDVLMRLLSSINAMKTMGMNPYMQEAYGNQAQAGFANAASADLNSGGQFNAANHFANNDPYGLWGLKLNPNQPGGPNSGPTSPGLRNSTPY